MIGTYARLGAGVETQPGSDHVLELEGRSKIPLGFLQLGLGKPGRANARLDERHRGALAKAELEHRHDRDRGGTVCLPTGQPGIPVALKPHITAIALPQGAAKIELHTQPIDLVRIGGLAHFEGQSPLGESGLHSHDAQQRRANQQTAFFHFLFPGQ